MDGSGKRGLFWCNYSKLDNLHIQKFLMVVASLIRVQLESHVL